MGKVDRFPVREAAWQLRPAGTRHQAGGVGHDAQVRQHGGARALGERVEVPVSGQMREFQPQRQPIDQACPGVDLFRSRGVKLEVAEEDDADAPRVVSLDMGPAHLQIAALENLPVAAHAKVVSDVGPFSLIHVQVLDRAHGGGIVFFVNNGMVDYHGLVDWAQIAFIFAPAIRVLRAVGSLLVFGVVIRCTRVPFGARCDIRAVDLFDSRSARGVRRRRERGSPIRT